MTAPTNTYLSSAAATSNREDLSNTIYRISPTITPFMSLCAKTKATNTLHEWQTQDLAAAANNAQAEGDDASAKVVTVPVRLTNKTQISTKTVIVSGTQEAVNKAGRSSEMGYQASLASLEIKRDMEFALTQNNVTATSPRQTRGLVGWAGDNTDGQTAVTAYVAPVYTANPGTAQTDGTQRAFTESQMKNVLQLCFTAGGQPDTILLPPKAKQTFSTFTGNATRMDKSEDAKLYASIDVYVSDFGDLKAVPSRFQRVRDVWILQADKWAVAYLRPFFIKDLAPTGDAEKKEIIVEYALEARAPKASGSVVDIL